MDPLASAMQVFRFFKHVRYPQYFRYRFRSTRLLLPNASDWSILGVVVQIAKFSACDGYTMGSSLIQILATALHGWGRSLSSQVDVDVLLLNIMSCVMAISFVLSASEAEIACYKLDFAPRQSSPSGFSILLRCQPNYS